MIGAPHIPEEISQEWVDGVVADIIPQLEEALTSENLYEHRGKPLSKEQLALLKKPSWNPDSERNDENGPSVLERMIRGLVVEFIGQSVRNMPLPLKDDLTHWGDNEMAQNTIPGVMHTKALVKKALQLGLSEEDVMMLCKNIIAISANEFNNSYMILTGTYGSGHIAKDYKALTDFISAQAKTQYR